MKILQVMILSIFFVASGFAQTPTQFTVGDRERLVRVEEGQKILSKRVDETFADFGKRIDERFADLEKRMNENNQFLQRQIDDIKKFLLWGFGILFGGMGILIGFVIWDRRSALQPVATRQAYMDEELRRLILREQNIEEALKRYAGEEPRLGKILKSLDL